MTATATGGDTSKAAADAQAAAAAALADANASAANASNAADSAAAAETQAQAAAASAADAAASAADAVNGADSATANNINTGPQTRAALNTDHETYLGAVSVVAFGATGDGTTDDTQAFTDAATHAAAVNAAVYVPAPHTSYLLNTDPTIPSGTGFIGASPDWFSGAGTMPFHRFTQISEGVDPRIFAVPVMGYSEPAEGNAHRHWSVVGWVYAKNAPDATAAAATEADLVGVDGRGVVAVKDGRVWGLLGLAHMTAGAKGTDGAYGVSQAYAAELDVNNNTGDDANLDGGADTPIVLGVSIVSGGANRPAEAVRIDATSKPYGDAGAADNRFHTAMRVRGDAVKEYALLLDDGFEGVAMRIPTSSQGNHFTHLGTLSYAEYQDVNDLRRKMWSMVADHGYDFINAAGDRVFAINDGYAQAVKPFVRKASVQAAPTTVDASAADVFTLTAGATDITDITGGTDGQRITLINVTGGTLTVTPSASMRMSGGTPFAMPNLATMEFVYASPTWFEVARSVNS